MYAYDTNIYTYIYIIIHACIHTTHTYIEYVCVSADIIHEDKVIFFVFFSQKAVTEFWVSMRWKRKRLQRRRRQGELGLVLYIYVIYPYIFMYVDILVLYIHKFICLYYMHSTYVYSVYSLCIYILYIYIYIYVLYVCIYI